MGKSLRNRGPRTSKRRPVDSDEELLNEKDPDVNSRSYVYDEIDEFHANREKVLLDAGNTYQVDDESDEEEVYAVGGSGDDSDDDYGISVSQKKDDMASDLEDEVDDLPNAKAWGKRSKSYYDTDYVDKDYDKYDESDIEMAEAEEKEAKAIQQRMAEQLDDGDFGLDLFESVNKKPDKQEELKIEKDLSTLSKQEKLEILNRESPELLRLLQDFKDKLLEIRDHIRPLFELTKHEEIPSGPLADYINLKYQLLMNYCTNVSFYIMLKAKRVSLLDHPIIKRLVYYRKLMKELEPVDAAMGKDITNILDCVNADKPVTEVLRKEDKKAPTPLRRKQKLRVLDRHANNEEEHAAKNKSEDKSVTNQNKRNPKQMETADEKAALELYHLMKVGHQRSKVGKSAQEKNNEESIASSDDEMDVNETSIQENDAETVGKRGITYQIAKNKGLTPYRKKEVRNPRVKNRMKYRKAKIRRKGQVREVRKEMTKYGGEISGIKASTSRSIKLK